MFCFESAEVQSWGGMVGVASVDVARSYYGCRLPFLFQDSLRPRGDYR